MTTSQQWLIIFASVVLCVLIYLLAPVLTPFLIAILLAYFFNPLVGRLTAWHFPRILAVIVVFLIIAFVLFCFVFLILPLLEQQIVIMLKQIPKVSEWLTKTLWPWLNEHFHIRASIDLDDFRKALLNYLGGSNKITSNIWRMVSHSGMALIQFITALFLIPVLTFYLLCDWDRVTNAASKLLPRASEKNIVKIINACGEVLAAFFRGQLLVMICLGIIYSTGLWIIGLDVGILIGLLAGLLSIVPYLGFTSGILLAAIASLLQFHDWTHLLWIGLVFGIGELAESFVLVPWLVGDRIGLHPIAVIFAVLTGGQLFGFTGVLLAVPASAVIMVFLRNFYEYYLNSYYYSKQKKRVKK